MVKLRVWRFIIEEAKRLERTLQKLLEKRPSDVRAIFEWVEEVGGALELYFFFADLATIESAPDELKELIPKLRKYISEVNRKVKELRGW